MTYRPNLSTLAVLRGVSGALGHAPRVHPNGFIQLDLDKDGRRRLHVWHPNLPFRQRTFHPVHNHIFNFHSEVYTGRLINVTYEPWDANSVGTHVRFMAHCIGGSETVLEREEGDRSYFLHDVEAFSVQPGESYEFRAGEYHETLSNEPTLTVMTKQFQSGQTTGANCEGASIMVPVGVTPDNNFRRDAHDVGELWRLIGEAMP